MTDVSVFELTPFSLSTHKMFPHWAASSNVYVFGENDATFSVVLVWTVGEIASGRMRFHTTALE